MGVFEGTHHADQSQTTKASAKVIAEGPGYYRVVVQAEPLAPGEPTAQFEIYTATASATAMSGWSNLRTAPLECI
jgi:hypothetical protein